jgi:hypothetical protein
MVESLHRDMLLDVCRTIKVKITNTSDIDFLTNKDNESLLELI